MSIAPLHVVQTAPELRRPPGLVERLMGEGMIGFPSPPIPLKSGMSAPMYVNWRKVLGNVAFRNAVVTFLQNASPDFITKVCDVPVRDVIFAGVATGGISVPAMLADRLGVPFCYIPKDEKGHGLPETVVGTDVSGRKVILFEDVVTMATSSAPAVAALKAAGGDVRACISFFNYEFPEAAEAFKNFGVLHRSLCCFTDVKHYLQRDRLKLASALAEWHKDPWLWTDRMEGRTTL